MHAEKWPSSAISWSWSRCHWVQSGKERGRRECCCLCLDTDPKVYELSLYFSLHYFPLFEEQRDLSSVGYLHKCMLQQGLGTSSSVPYSAGVEGMRDPSTWVRSWSLEQSWDLNWGPLPLRDSNIPSHPHLNCYSKHHPQPSPWIFSELCQ